MKGLFNKYIWLQLILSILLLFGGAIVIIFAAMGKHEVLSDALNITTAVIMFIFGAFSILATFIFETKKVLTNGLLYGSAFIALGVFLLTKELNLLMYVVLLLAIFFIVFGGFELAKAILLTIKYKESIFAIVLSYVMAALFIAGGVLALVFRTNETTTTVFCIIGGVLLFLAGVYELIVGVKTMIVLNREKGGKKPAKKKEQAKKEEPVSEQQAEEVEEPKQLDEPKEEVKELDYTEPAAIEHKE